MQVGVHSPAQHACQQQDTSPDHTSQPPVVCRSSHTHATTLPSPDVPRMQKTASDLHSCKLYCIKYSTNLYYKAKLQACPVLVWQVFLCIPWYYLCYPEARGLPRQELTIASLTISKKIWSVTNMAVPAASANLMNAANNNNSIVIIGC